MSRQLGPRIRVREVNVARLPERRVSDHHRGTSGLAARLPGCRAAGVFSWGTVSETSHRGALLPVVKLEFGSRFIAGLGEVLPDEELADGTQLDRLRRVL